MKVLLFASFLCVVIFFCEVVYSFYKKDGVYSKRGTTGNVFTFVVLSLISQKITPVYLAFFVVWYSFLNTTIAPLYATSFILALILVDFTYYIFHRTLHKVDFFWRFHSVHHSDRNLNLSTSFRISIVEHVGILTFFSTGFFLGFQPTVVFSAISALGLYQFITHSSYIHFPKILEYIFVTPQTHRTHHDQSAVRHNSNFGGIFSIWDKLFDTYTGRHALGAIGLLEYHEDNPFKLQIKPFLKEKKAS